MREANEKSARAAKLLTAVGMAVSVRTDDGRSVVTKTTSEPWQLGHGAWVVSLEGFLSGGYDCGRVTPVESGGGGLKVGDQVTWMDVTTRGSSMSFSQREGKIHAIQGSGATVKMRNGRTSVVGLTDLRLTTAKNHVTELFEKLAGKTEIEG